MLNEHRGGDLTEWISDGDEIIVDFVARYETLNEDWRARYVELLRSRLSRWDEKTRLSVRIIESFTMTNQGSSWRIALRARLSYSVIVSIANAGRRAKDLVSNSSLPNYSQVLRKGLLSR
jgi:hypothetical protein